MKILNKKPKIGLFMNARDEDNLKEWIAHHLLLGFNQIIIFDHKSIHPIKHLLQPLQKKVEVIECNLEKGIKMPLMNEAIKIAKSKKMDWFIYLDADEFIILNTTNTIHDFIDLYKDFDSIGINWVMFGSNFHVNIPSGLILENFTKTTTENLNKLVKSMVKTSEVIKANNPHFYFINNPSKMIGTDYKIITRPYPRHECSVPRNEVSAYIAHYAIQSKETYIKRKINRPRDDSGTLRDNTNLNLLNLDGLNNSLENLVPKQKYADKIKRFLNKNCIFI